MGSKSHSNVANMGCHSPRGTTFVVGHKGVPGTSLIQSHLCWANQPSCQLDLLFFVYKDVLQPLERQMCLEWGYPCWGLLMKPPSDWHTVVRTEAEGLVTKER